MVQQISRDLRDSRNPFRLRRSGGVSSCGRPGVAPLYRLRVGSSIGIGQVWLGFSGCWVGCSTGQSPINQVGLGLYAFFVLISGFWSVQCSLVDWFFGLTDG
jgi:hypothetical protein